jgi:hypothetical protein
MVCCQRIHSYTLSNYCSIAVIQPRLNLHAGGSRIIANITSKGRSYSVSWGDTLTVGVFGGCYCVWNGQDGSAVAQIYAEEKWLSLNQKPSRGIIKARKA